MGFTEQLRVRREKQKAPAIPLPEGPTLADIRQDEEQMHLFGELLKKDKGLTERFLSREPEGGDSAKLAKYRRTFLERMAETEKVEVWVEAWLSDKNVRDNLARKHPDFFREIVEPAGVAGTLEVIKSQLKKIAITDERRFKNILSAVDIQANHNLVLEKNDQKVEELLKAKNISPQEYEDALAIEDATKREEALGQLAKKYAENSRSWKFWNRKAEDAKAQADLLGELKNPVPELEKAIAQLDDDEKNIGKALFATITRNDDMRKALADVSLEGEVEEEKRVGLDEAKFDEGKYQEDWRNFKKKKVRPEWSKLSPATQDRERDRFIQQKEQDYDERTKGKKSFLVEIMEALAKAFMNDKSKLT